jgi:uncharacterized protein YndB with AHSA1/START domain
MNETLVIEAVRKTVTVDCAVEEAFRVFTADMGSWWPTDTHALHAGEVREVVLEPRAGGEVYEIANDGEKGHWATVIALEPPNRLVLAWEVNPKRLGTEVEVRFTPQGTSTRVDLEHRGWENLVDGAEARADYHTGWDHVLARYVDRL